MLRMEHERGRFAGLLATQVFLIAVTPFVSDAGTGSVFLRVAVFGIMLAGVYAASQRRAVLNASLVVLILAIGAWLGPDFFSKRVDDTLRLATAALSFGLTAAIVVMAVSRHERVTADTILGGINAYLLIAFAFMMLHATVVVANPHAYTIAGESLHEVLTKGPDSHGFATMLYFSFTTLTTLGYGDIVPVDPVARLLTSGEAVIGQLYVAIFIGRLIGLEVSARSAGRAGRS